MHDLAFSLSDLYNSTDACSRCASRPVSICLDAHMLLSNCAHKYIAFVLQCLFHHDVFTFLHMNSSCNSDWLPSFLLALAITPTSTLCSPQASLANATLAGNIISCGCCYIFCDAKGLGVVPSLRRARELSNVPIRGDAHSTVQFREDFGECGRTGSCEATGEDEDAARPDRIGKSGVDVRSLPRVHRPRSEVGRASPWICRARWTYGRRP